MSEHEKLLQVGRLAEEYSQLKGELNHVEEKLARCQKAYQFAGQHFQYIGVKDGKLYVNPNTVRPTVGSSPDDLLGAHQLFEAITERDRLRGEVSQTATRLRALAPHLV